MNLSLRKYTKLLLKWRMLKPPPVNPRAWAFSVLKCNCQTYIDNIGQIIHYFNGSIYVTEVTQKTDVAKKYIIIKVVRLQIFEEINYSL